LLYSPSTSLFSEMHNPLHCLHRFLPPAKALDYSLRNSQQLALPQFKYQLFKTSFINWCPFNDL